MTQRRLEPIPLGLFGGLNTYAAPEDQAGKTLTVAQNVDGYDRFRGVGKVPGSTEVGEAHGDSIASLHYFEYTDLDLIRQREIISLAGGTLRTIDPDDGILTSLYSGLTDELLSGVVNQNRLYLSGPGQRGLPTGGLRYDGTNVRNWGVLGPGETSIVVDALDDASDWTDSPAVDSETLAGTFSVDGTASIRVKKVGTGTTDAFIQQSGMALDLSDVGQNEAFVWLFVPFGGLSNLAASGPAAEVRIGNAGLTAADRHTFEIGELVHGWNLLILDLITPDDQVGAGADLSAIDTVRFHLHARTAATTWTDFRWDDFHVRDEGRPTASVGGAGNLNGEYTYVVSFLSEAGFESNAGFASGSVTPVDEEVDLTSIPVSTDDQVIGRRIYRDVSGDGIYRFVGQIDNNVDTTFTDNVPDISLGTDQPPFAGDAFLDSSAPGRLYDTILHAGRVIGVDGGFRNVLKVSEANNPDAFRLVDQILLEEEIVGLENHTAGTLIYATDKVFILSGDGINFPLRVDELTSELGANGRSAILRAKGLNVVVRETEVFLVADPSDPWLLNGAVYDKFQDLSIAELVDMRIAHDRARFRFVFFPSGSDEAFVYQYGTKDIAQVTGEGAGVDPIDLRNGAWWTMKFAVTPTAVAIVERSDDRPEMWVGASDGRVYWVGDPSTKNWATAGGDVPMEAVITFAAVPLGSSPAGRGEPRFLMVNAEADAASEWDITVDLLKDAEGAAITTTTGTLSLEAGKNSPMRPLKGGRGAWGRITLSNENIDEDAIFSRIALMVMPRRSSLEGART